MDIHEKETGSTAAMNIISRWTIGIASIVIPGMLLLQEIYGSFIFSFSIPLLWHVAYRGHELEALGIRKKSIGLSIAAGVISGLILIIIGGILLRLLGLTNISIAATDQLKISLGGYRINFKLANELSYRLLLASGSLKGLSIYLIFYLFAIGLGEEIFWRGFVAERDPV